MSTITQASYLSQLKTISLNPEIYYDITGMPTNEPYDYIFSKNYKVSPNAEMLRSFWTKEIELVTYRAKGGKYQPVQKESVSLEKLSPLDIKLTNEILSDELEDYMRLAGSLKTQNDAVLSLANIYSDRIETFQMTKQKMIMNQCSEFLGTGSVSFQYKDNDNLLNTKTLDFTEIDGDIASHAYSDDDYSGDWSGSGVTADLIFADLNTMRKYSYDATDGKFFKPTAPLILFAGSTAYQTIIGKYDHENPILTRDGFDYMFVSGGVKIKIVESSMTREYKKFSAGKYADTSESKLAAKAVMLVDDSAGNFGITDLKYVTLQNAGKNIAAPFNVTFEPKRPADEGIDIFYTTRPLVWGRTKALHKFTTQA